MNLNEYVLLLIFNPLFIFIHLLIILYHPYFSIFPLHIYFIILFNQHNLNVQYKILFIIFQNFKSLNFDLLKFDFEKLNYFQAISFTYQKFYYQNKVFRPIFIQYSTNFHKILH